MPALLVAAKAKLKVHEKERNDDSCDCFPILLRCNNACLILSYNNSHCTGYSIAWLWSTMWVPHINTRPDCYYDFVGEKGLAPYLDLSITFHRNKASIGKQVLNFSHFYRPFNIDKVDHDCCSPKCS